jgi:hypothetical protein
MCTIRVGGERAEFLAITLLGRSHPTAGEYWDGNWVRAIVEVVAGGFRGEVGGDLRTDELAAFHRELFPLVESLSGSARLSTQEDWLSIVVTGDGRGHMELSCEIRDQPGVGNSLAFRLALDQTYLRSMAEQLGRAVSEYPVIGRPDA